MLRRSCGIFLAGIWAMSPPAMRTLPSVTSSSRIRDLIRVDLPQPVGPTRKTNSPRPTDIETRSSAMWPPGYTLVTPFSSMIGARRPRERTGSGARFLLRRILAIGAGVLLREQDEPFGVSAAKFRAQKTTVWL